jgi:glutathione S-transferase
MLTLYYAPGASSFAAHIALNEIGVPFELKPVSLANKEQRSPGYLAINPEGKVPTLLIDGRPMTEVAGILYYLARRFPDARLLPVGDSEAEAHVVSWMAFVASTIHPSRARGHEANMAAFALADRRLGSAAWTVGQSYSIADIHLFRLFWRLLYAVKVPRGTFPSLEAHFDRVMARPAVVRTIEIEKAVGYELP